MSVRKPVCTAAAALALALVLGACGGSSARMPGLAGLPLVPGAQVVVQKRTCDKGASPYCAVELVVVDPGSHSGDALFKRERRRLDRAGWTNANGETGDEAAADSPGHRLHLIYATASGDLKGIDLGWIQRERPITLALSQSLFARSAALSLMLELGSGRGN